MRVTAIGRSASGVGSLSRGGFVAVVSFDDERGR
jgi:hypothetical protein